MNRSRFSPLVGSALGLVGYLIGAFVLISSGPSEAAGAFFFFALFGVIPAIVVGGIVGGIFGKSRLSTGGLAGLAAGFIFPFLAVYSVKLYTGAQSQVRRDAYEAESKQAIAQAKSRGFKFPPDAKPGMIGQAWSKASLNEVRDFYSRELSADWERKDLVSTVWYVKKSDSAQVDQIQVRREYERTSIYYRTTEYSQLQVHVASAFAQAVDTSDWKTVESLCDPNLARIGATGIQKKLRGLKPSSPAFLRKYMPPGNSAPIGINAQFELEKNTFRSAEIGLVLSTDPFPLVQRIETSLP